MTIEYVTEHTDVGVILTPVLLLAEHYHILVSKVFKLCLLIETYYFTANKQHSCWLSSDQFSNTAQYFGILMDI